MKRSKQSKIKRWTREEVELLLNESNHILLGNIFLIEYLKKQFLATSAYCLSLLPVEEDIYEVLVNGSIIIELEFNRRTHDIFIVSTIDIDEYINTLTNESGKIFYRLAKEIGRQSINI